MKHLLLTVCISVLTSGIIMTLGYFSLVRDISQLSPFLSDTNQRAEQAASTPSVADIVDASIPAVVSIVITANVPVIERYYEDFWSPFGSLFGPSFQIPRQRQVGTERQEIGGGTGFFVSEDGYLLTNRHVVDQEGVEYSIVTNDGETYEVEVVAKDPSLDVAILKVEAKDTTFPYLTLAEAEELRLGETVIAIGNALAEFPNSVSVGVVSGLSRNIVASDSFNQREALEGVIQTDAAINQGNSGGPLINTKGEVIGVNVAIAGGGENIGFALPAPAVRAVYESVLEHGEIIRPFLGVRTMQITPEIADRNDLPYDYGALIVRGLTPTDLAIVPGSPADKAGLEENDIILKINDQRLDGSRSLASIIRSFAVNETITLTVFHDGEEKEMSVTLEKR